VYVYMYSVCIYV